ncbi:uncharacterized protein HMPREF1541_00752 [Cyphellophora europaea CBS 101466]|uniref:Uncharacterized protein n=1 Tax=Cyphellophora europaea (strain CBS 101466) TaxID=1220924 RepID=W2SCY4_CYPE1|nr:uncharacterized protein HMPREF1541_00752 [Cyphellophora europaea CBS 101466]ETN46567.1 hypothetical protein HMPREF1541_00752 [Cyphellophora europaea CBS 101466]
MSGRPSDRPRGSRGGSGGRGGRGGGTGGRNQALTAGQRNTRINVLRSRLQPHTTDENLLTAYLAANQWRIDAASTQILQDHNQVEGERLAIPNNPPLGSNAQADTSTFQQTVAPVAQPTQAPPSTQPAAATTWNAVITQAAKTLIDILRQANIPSTSHLESERRDTARLFRDRLAQRYLINAGDLVAMEEILLLHLAGWDIGTAIAKFQTLRHSLCTLHAHFDHLRSKLTEEVYSQDRASQEQKDERLTLLLTITGRSDWFSIREYLKLREWDLPLALGNW